jgi:hypothetical protein
MRKLLYLLILVSALWSGYWFAGSTVLRNGADQWFADQAARGMTAEKTGLTVSGFPNRFDLTVEGVVLSDPQSGIGWQAPFVQVFAMTWKPWHIIAALPPDQVIRLPDQDIALASTGLRASLRSKPSTDVPLAAAIIESDSLLATSSKGWSVGAARSVASISADEEVEGAGDQPNAYVLALDIADFAPGPLEPIATKANLPPTISALRIVATATLTAPLDRRAGDVRPQIVTLKLDDCSLAWGDLGVTAKGELAPDPAGFAAGRIEIAVTNWDRLVPVLVAANAIKPEVAPTVQNMLGALARDGGDPMVLKLPLVLKDGRMSLGPLPLGPAPMLVAPTG